MPTEAPPGWTALLERRRLVPLCVLFGGVLLNSMNVLMVATVLPDIVQELGGTPLMSWPTTAYLATSIVAATCTGMVSARLGAARTYFVGALTFAAGTLACGMAASMLEVIGGRLVQGFGGGLLAGVAYVLVRQTFPTALWPRVFAMLAGAWSISVLFGPLMGGAFAQFGDWRGAFFAVAALGGLVAVFGVVSLPRAQNGSTESMAVLPLGRVSLICGAIAVLSLAGIAQDAVGRALLLAAGITALAVTQRLDRRSPNPLLPTDAFSIRSITGLGLWVALLVSVAFAPLQIYLPAFLQHLHDLEPLSAGYMVAGASLAWTLMAILVSGFPARRALRCIALGPLLMSLGLAGIGVSMPGGPLVLVLGVVVLVGGGIGMCWSFVAQQVMSGAHEGEHDLAASAVATVQQTGVAIGAALAGVLANANGFTLGESAAGLAAAARWMPLGFALVAVGGCLAGTRLGVLASRRGA